MGFPSEEDEVVVAARQAADLFEHGVRGAPGAIDGKEGEQGQHGDFLSRTIVRNMGERKVLLSPGRVQAW